MEKWGVCWSWNVPQVHSCSVTVAATANVHFFEKYATLQSPLYSAAVALGIHFASLTTFTATAILANLAIHLSWQCIGDAAL